jgi:PKHD-type hydroxylase
MIIRIPNVLTPAQVQACRQALETAPWMEGRATAGKLTQRSKNNMQVPAGHPIAQRLSEMILDALKKNILFMRAALPLRFVPPLFNRYTPGEFYGDHVDSTVQQAWGVNNPVRTDLSATLFLSAPEEYDGGELTLVDELGERSVKLPAGDLVLYPATSVHHVSPVTRGARLASFFWIQSMVREDSHRALLFELGTALRQVEDIAPDHAVVVKLTGVYFNLFRLWTDTH